MPTMPDWQLQNPIDAVIFDCDGTLSSIEGIDELADMNHTGPAVAALTQEAMERTGLNPDIYRQRLQLVLPSKQQVLELGARYQATLVPEAKSVIQILKRLNKPVFLASAGIKLAVDLLGEALNIPSSHIFAVDVTFTPNGSYLDFDTTSPLTRSNGKCDIAQRLKKQYPALAQVGDGMNDFVVRDTVTRFIGYGGVFYRENIAAGCEFYIKTPSLASVLPLLLTQAEAATLSTAEAAIYQQGLDHADYI